jgi:hypothetical protein
LIFLIRSLSKVVLYGLLFFSIIFLNIWLYGRQYFSLTKMVIWLYCYQ